MAKTCFFISRIGDAGSPEREFSDKLLKYIVAPALERCGYETPIRADHITQPGVITTQVFSHLWDDDLVIADLTGSNPNVFYELAVRHIRRKPFIHLIQAGHKIPFDVAPNRTIEFDFDIEKAEIAKAALEGMVQNSNDEPANVQTPLSAAIDFSTAGASSDPMRDGIAQLLSIAQEIKGTVDRLPAGPRRGNEDTRKSKYAFRRSGDRFLLSMGSALVAEFDDENAALSFLSRVMGDDGNAERLLEDMGSETTVQLTISQDTLRRSLSEAES